MKIPNKLKSKNHSHEMGKDGQQDARGNIECVSDNIPNTENINDCATSEEVSKEIDSRDFIKAEINRIAERFKMQESDVVSYVGNYLSVYEYCSKEKGAELKNLQGEALIDEIINIANSNKPEKKIDFAGFFNNIEYEIKDDFAVMQLSALPIWDEMLEMLEEQDGNK